MNGGAAEGARMGVDSAGDVDVLSLDFTKLPSSSPAMLRRYVAQI